MGVLVVQSMGKKSPAKATVAKAADIRQEVDVLCHLVFAIETFARVLTVDGGEVFF
jgi:hypothetical protein